MRRSYCLKSVLDGGSLEEIRGWRKHERRKGTDRGTDKGKAREGRRERKERKGKERERKGNLKRRQIQIKGRKKRGRKGKGKGNGGWDRDRDRDTEREKGTKTLSWGSKGTFSAHTMGCSAEEYKAFVWIAGFRDQSIALEGVYDTHCCGIDSFNTRACEAATSYSSREISCWRVEL